MCLIAYSPTGELMPYSVFSQAAIDNPDGIGVMSAYAVKRFVGPRQTIQAWKLISRLASEGIPYGIHFRWRTHGPISAALCHPFKSPDGGTYVMHNGIIGHTAAYATKSESDTSVFVRDFIDLTGMDPEADAYAQELSEIEKFIGWGNKLLVLDMDSGLFSICNEASGEWIGGLWYSNDYSHPAAVLPTKYARWLSLPARKLTEIGNTYKALLTAPAIDNDVDDTLTAAEVKEMRRAAGLAKKEMPHIDNEASYYRTLCQSAGYYDTGTEDYPLPNADDAIGEDSAEYRDILRRLNATGMGR